jgi:hypothetical protein
MITKDDPMAKVELIVVGAVDGALFDLSLTV